MSKTPKSSEETRYTILPGLPGGPPLTAPTIRRAATVRIENCVIDSCGAGVVVMGDGHQIEIDGLEVRNTLTAIDVNGNSEVLVKRLSHTEDDEA
jgi:hypothetical protein